MLIVQEIAHFKQPSRPNGLNVVSESKFCAEFEKPFRSCRTGRFKAPERGNCPTPHFFQMCQNFIYSQNVLAYAPNDLKFGM